MTTVAAYANHETALSIRDDQQVFTPNQLAALEQLGVVNAPPAQSAVFFHHAVRTGLDPFAKQIYMIGRNSKEMVWNPDTRSREERYVMKYTIQTGIDGYRLIARRAADRAKEELRYGDTLWCGPDGIWMDVWVYDRPPTAAKVTVFRGGCPFTHVSVWREYVQTFYDKARKEHVPNSMWLRMSSNQLAKTAEAGALRKAFPQDLSGVFVDDEMPDVEPTDMGETPQEPVTIQRVRTTAQKPEPAPEQVQDPAADVVDEPTPPEPVEEPPAQPEPEQAPSQVPDPELDANPTAPDPSDVEPCSLEQRREVGKILTKLYGSTDNTAKAEALTAWTGRPIAAIKALTAVEAAQFIAEAADESK